MKRYMIPIAAIALLVLATTSVNAGAVYATVTGYEAFSEEANHAAYWGEDCVKDESVDGDTEFVLPEGFFGTVIVKAGSGEFANTIFAGASGGETVWADTDGDGVFNDGELSHVILCEEEPPTEPPATDEVTAPPTDEPTLPPATDTPTEEPPVAGPPVTAPPTDTVGSSGTSSTLPLLLALGVLLGSLVVIRLGKRI